MVITNSRIKSRRENILNYGGFINPPVLFAIFSEAIGSFFVFLSLDFFTFFIFYYSFILLYKLNTHLPSLNFDQLKVSKNFFLWNIYGTIIYIYPLFLTNKYEQFIVSFQMIEIIHNKLSCFEYQAHCYFLLVKYHSEFIR